MVAALLFAGRAGSALTAEIGLMRATEQLSSMEMMAVDPLRRVMSPRFWAGVISLPLLTVIFVAVGIWGGALVGVSWKGIDSGFFWSAMQNAVDWRMDLVNCLIKSVVFAITVTWISALLFAGRAGSALTAEIGLMRATEQLSSMEMMAVDPLRRVISPRFWAGVISLPLLTVIFVAVGIWGGSLVGVSWKGIDSGFFWSAMQNAVDWRMDLVNCLIKSVVFAITVTWISLFNGYDAIPTSAGISRATTRTVVHSSLAVPLAPLSTRLWLFWGWILC